jgi:hypothetical protein
MDDGDGLGHFFASPVPDPHGVGEMQPLSIRAYVDRKNLITEDPLAGAGAAGSKAALLRQLIDIEHPTRFYRYASSVLPPS